MTTPTTVTKTNFDAAVLQSDKPVLVDFWASWCGPCKQIAPVLDEISAEREDLVIAKVDVDDNPELAQRYQVKSIPTILVFQGGQIVERVVGYVPKAQLLAQVTAKLA